MSALSERFFEIKNRINKLKTSPVTLIAVSKLQPLNTIEELYHLGHRDFGENYAQELIEKEKLLREKGLKEIRWHFIGHLQTNKVKSLIPFIESIHTLDSFRLAEEISKQWTRFRGNTKAPVFVEVNINSEITKHGIYKENINELISKISSLENISILGLMCIPNQNSSPKESFAQLKALELTCRPNTHGMLSMGMSDDFELAIHEGATHIRVGSSIFGPRLTR